MLSRKSILRDLHDKKKIDDVKVLRLCDLVRNENGD
jgi:hypothetical protein